ncbi:Os03g0723800 [Oryza sativa Japonica Group]|uniref:Os03g0723800 protein n=1 Tax=Oryza sativa subsp. japonica TaxID=39947 RepID=Q0DP05_ORYSJ|nr:Os03g0723800 [Oryza sativa Japonica Group]|eukprot:NP_001051119.1 Os03g0723800 [Oryza sativa Japonica Group]
MSLHAAGFGCCDRGGDGGSLAGFCAFRSAACSFGVPVGVGVCGCGSFSAGGAGASLFISGSASSGSRADCDSRSYSGSGTVSSDDAPPSFPLPTQSMSSSCWWLPPPALRLCRRALNLDPLPLPPP